MNGEHRKQIIETIAELDEIIFGLLEVQEDEALEYSRLPKSLRTGGQGKAWREDKRILSSSISCLFDAKRHLENLE